MQKKKQVLLIILACLCAFLILAGIIRVYQERTRTPDKMTALENTLLPSDFHLVFTWGECAADAGRTALEINASGHLYAAQIDAGGQSGLEAARDLNQNERRTLLDKLAQADVMTLPAQIVSGEEIIPLDPGCSQLQLTQNGNSKTIDEANGINARYYDLKLFLESLTVAP